MGIMFVALILSVGFTNLEGFSYKNYNLDSYCGDTIKLACDRDSSNRAGTFKYDVYLAAQSSCVVNITVGSSSLCPSSALYFNIKKQKMPTNGRFIVKEKVSWLTDTWTEKKNLMGDGIVVYDPTSVAQYRSSYVTNPQISLIFQASASSMSSGYFTITLDYSVVYQYSSSSDTYCSGLSGYVLDEMICETGDRVTCPTSYYDTTGETNAAYTNNQGTQSVCGLSTGSIAGTVVGVIVGVVVFAAVVTVITRHRRNIILRSHVNTQYPHSTPPTVNVITTNYPAPYPAHQPQFANYSGPPPGYPAPYPGHPAAGPGYPTPMPPVGGQPAAPRPQ